MAEAENTTSEAQSATYQSGCHCGVTSFSATVSPPLDQGHEVTQCNCSICITNGYCFVYVPKVAVVWEKGGDQEMKMYRFGKEKIGHFFCPNCGTSVCARSLDPEWFPDMWALNVRCFKDVDIDSLKFKTLDGKKF